MINDLISTFLTNNKRIVIPGLGAFLRKSADQSIVFVQFLNHTQISCFFCRQYSG